MSEFLTTARAERDRLARRIELLDALIEEYEPLVEPVDVEGEPDAPRAARPTEVELHLWLAAERRLPEGGADLGWTPTSEGWARPIGHPDKPCGYDVIEDHGDHYERQMWSHSGRIWPARRTTYAREAMRLPNLESL